MAKFEHYEIIKILKQKNENKKTLVVKSKKTGDKYVAKLFSAKDNFSNIAWMREKTVDFNHPNICKLIDYGEEFDYNFTVREFVNGIRWNDFYKTAKIDKKERLKLIVNQTIEVLEALKILHSNKIIHRDIRPENILIENKKAILIDFESAKCEKLKEIDKYSMFTFVYSAPEQVLKINELVNESSDIYSLGVTLWVLFNGKLPFVHPIPEVIANLQVTYPIQINRNIPKKFRPIIEKATKKYKFSRPPLKIPIDQRKEMLQQAQKQRYQSAEEMINDLKAILH